MPAPPRQALKDDALQRAVADCPGWALREGRLSRSFQFPDFNAAFGFMTRVALLAEQCNHHPNWSNVYNRVEIALHTHDLQALSTWDIWMAQRISEFAAG